MERLKENMFILYVRPQLKADRSILDKLPIDAPIYVQDVNKLPSIPSNLRGTPVLIEPRRSMSYEGSKCIEIVDLYLEFLRFHPYALLRTKKEVQAVVPEPPNPIPPPPAAAAPPRDPELLREPEPVVTAVQPPDSPVPIKSLIPPRKKRTLS